MSGTTTTPGVVSFDYGAWSARYPELAALVQQPQANAYFPEACLYLNNTAQSVVQDLPTRSVLLNMIVAHIAQLNLPEADGGNGAGFVGRVTAATRGTVSIATSMGPESGSAAWFQQTQYGASFWQATAQYRQMRFIPGRSPRTRMWP